VPKDILEKVEKMCKWDESNNKWVMQGAELVGNKKRGFI